MKRLNDLYILNMNEASMALDDDVNVEMHRLRTEAALKLCYVPLYKTEPGKKLHSTMQDPCKNIVGMLNWNQMCWQQMPLDLLKRGCAEGTNMYTML